MPKKHKRQRGGLTITRKINYNEELTERSAPTGRFRVITNVPDEGGFDLLGDYKTLKEAKIMADGFIVGLISLGWHGAAYVHSDVNRVLYTAEE